MPRAPQRCFWAGDDPLMVAYHDEEWGVPIHDDRRWYEKLLLDGAQAGLSWLDDPAASARATATRSAASTRRRSRASASATSTRLMKDAGIVRNRLKIKSAIGNARAFLALAAEHGSFDAWIWRFVGGKPIAGKRRGRGDMPGAHAAVRRAVAGAARPRVLFVGSTIVYAFMQAAGLVNDHTLGCFRRAQVAALGRPAPTANA